MKRTTGAILLIDPNKCMQPALFSPLPQAQAPLKHFLPPEHWMPHAPQLQWVGEGGRTEGRDWMQACSGGGADKCALPPTHPRSLAHCAPPPPVRMEGRGQARMPFSSHPVPHSTRPNLLGIIILGVDADVATESCACPKGGAQGEHHLLCTNGQHAAARARSAAQCPHLAAMPCHTKRQLSHWDARPAGTTSITRCVELSTPRTHVAWAHRWRTCSFRHCRPSHRHT